MNTTLQDDLNEELNSNRNKPKLIQSSQSSSINLSIESEEVSSHPGMKFIPGYQYKDTVYDKNLKKFVKTDNKTSNELKDSLNNNHSKTNTNINNSDLQKVNTTEKDDMLEALNQITDVNDTTRSVVEKHSRFFWKRT
ncbi:unnamed protein product [[Candida] boidinii]|nr:unnamed protein product [[Candida] boidinii]